MKKNVTQKLIESHLVFGKMEPGSEIGITIDQTLTQDATGTVVMLEFEAMGILDYENLPDDGDINWSAMERPLDTDEAVSYEQEALKEHLDKTVHAKMDEMAQAS